MKDERGRRTPLCPRCIHWDPRPEDGLGYRTGYCIARDIITAYRYECEYFHEATRERREQRDRKIYGEFEDEEELYEGM